MPKVHHIGDYWATVSDSQYRPFTPHEIAQIINQFDVRGRVRNIEKAPGYAVSEYDRVFSRVPCSWKQGEPIREMKFITMPDGRYSVRLQVQKRPSRDLVHRLVAFTFLPPPGEGQTVVRHLDGNPVNNFADNLAWGTQAENMADCIRHGRTLKGIKNPNAKLTAKRAELVRGLNEEGFSQRAIAAFFSVSPKTVEMVCKGESWADA